DQHPLKKQESIWIQAKRSDLPNQLLPTENVGIAIGLGGGLFYGQYNEYLYVYFNSRLRHIQLQIASTFRSVPSIKGQQRCSEKQSHESCMSECRRDYFRGQCGCFPTFGNMVSREGGNNAKGIVFDDTNYLKLQ